MAEEQKLSLTYEQIYQVAENKIKECNLVQRGISYVQELSKAHEYLHFWHVLALKCYPDTPDWDRVHNDFQRLHSLIKNNEGECPKAD